MRQAPQACRDAELGSAISRLTHLLKSLSQGVSLCAVDDRGWGWPASETRRAQLVEWIVSRSAGQPDNSYLYISEFYDALPDQDMNTYVIALSDANDLEDRSLLELGNSYGSVTSLMVLVTPAARTFAENLQTARRSKQRRRSACRDAMVNWLYSCDVMSPPGLVRDKMLQDPEHSYFFAESFSADDLDAAAAWLYRHNLVRGAMMAQAEGPVRLYLTDSGVTCAEDFGSDSDAYLRRLPANSGPTVIIGTNAGPFQVAGDRAQQVQNFGASADDLRLLITGIAEIVRALVPAAADADAQEKAAIAAVADTSVDKSALQRFRDWAVSTVRAGATNAAVAAISSATTTLLIEAGHLASHLA